MTIPNKEKPFTSHIEKNPFFMLSVSCLDDRRKIISAAEEISFLSDADECIKAQNTLITPNKRISAELDWFIETDISLLNEIKTCLNNNNPIFIDNLNDLSKLNAMIYNCCISDETDSFSLELEILDIDKQFGELTPTTLTEIINNCRRISKMAKVTESDVSIELSRKRERIRSIVSEKLQLLEESEYIELVTLFAEKYIANDEYYDSGIISDVIDQYEIWAKSITESKEDKIRNHIETIKRIDDDVRLKVAIRDLVDLVGDWDKYAQPLQISSTAKGTEDESSKNMAISLRNLSLFLNNEKEKTSFALEILIALKKHFSEISLPFDLQEDLRILNQTQYNIIKETEEKKEGLRRNREDKEYWITVFDSSYFVPAYCTCCMKPTTTTEDISFSKTESESTWNGRKETQHTLTCHFPICPECLEHRNKFSNATVFLCCGSILFGAIIMIVFTLLFEIGGFNSFLVGGSFALVCFIILSLVFKIEELPIEHSTRNNSVSITTDFANGRASHIVFRFKNWQYANIFRAQNLDNSTTISEKTCKNSAKKTTFMNSYESATSNAFLMLVVYVFIAIIIAFVLYFTGAYDNKKNTSALISPSSHNSSSSYSSSSSSSSSTYNSSSSSVEKQFSQSVSSGTKVYANIVSISPEMGIYTQGSSNYSSFVCKCKTSAGTTVWVHMSVLEYSSNFDSSASSSIYNEYAEEVTFSFSKKIRGTAKTSNSVLSGLSSDIGASMLIDFTSVN